jgi:hypothetical protein
MDWDRACGGEAAEAGRFPARLCLCELGDARITSCLAQIIWKITIIQPCRFLPQLPSAEVDKRQPQTAKHFEFSYSDLVTAANITIHEKKSILAFQVPARPRGAPENVRALVGPALTCSHVRRL